MVLADENSKYQLEVDIIESLFIRFEMWYEEILQDYFNTKKKEGYNLEAKLKKVILLSDVKWSLESFFNSFSVNDAYFDIYQLYRNNQLIDKSEVYLYFYEIALWNEKFPLFYTSITIDKWNDKFDIIFENRIFLNTKAIDFIVQEYNIQAENQSTLTWMFDRIMYVNEDEKMYTTIETIVRRIEDFFEFNKNIDLKDESLQKWVNLIASLSNKSYVFLFDKSDESLINDYEEILNSEDWLIEDFSELLNGFIKDNPTSFISDVENEWSGTSTSDKLIFESPVPLNEEQKQVLIALSKKDCKYLILEWPPWTWKSHTITAIICRALLEEKSVLVLSDKKEALDVVEDKITSTLNKIRKEDDFQNPILRLWKTWNKFYKIVQGQIVEKIKEHYRAYKNQKDKYEWDRKNLIKGLQDNLDENIQHYTDIDIWDIKFYFGNKNDLSDINWISDENVWEIREDLLLVKEKLINLKQYSNFSFTSSFISQEHYNSLGELTEELDSLEKLKGKYDNLKTFEKKFQAIKDYDESKLEELYDSIDELLQSYISLKTSIGKCKYAWINNIKSSDLLSETSWKIEYADTVDSALKNAIKFNNNNENLKLLLHNLLIPDDIGIKEWIEELGKYLHSLKDIRNPIFWYIWKKNKINDRTRLFKKTFNFFNVENPEKNIVEITAVYDLYVFIYSKIHKEDSSDELFRDVIKLLIVENDKIESIYEIISNLWSLNDSVNSVSNIFPEISIDDLPSLLDWIAINIHTQNVEVIRDEIDDDNLEINSDEKHLIHDELAKEIKYIKDVLWLLSELIKKQEDIDYLINFQDKYPIISENIKLNIDSEKICDIECELLNTKDDRINKYLKYKEIEQSVSKSFKDLPDDHYSQLISEIESLVTAKMTYFLDERVINYIQDYPNDVWTIKWIIKKKQRFPKKLFNNMKKAFPCILAWIRDYAEYIPLEKNLFDLIIIDEASQVSIAQALPALIRWKKVVVLGDDKQFSNVKANNASGALNMTYKNRIKSTFLEWNDDEDSKACLSKIEDNFDIKNSILKFIKFIRNYECSLRKHFRCYSEIISYSNKYFYNGYLQCMKIRWKPVEDVIKFDVIDHDWKIDEFKNTNELEVDFIVNKLKEFKENNIVQSLWIITPHREQATLLSDKIYEMPERDWLFETCKLRIMTFDTCQWEERDYIFYSMVASKEKDRLKYIFINKLESIDEEVEWKIRAQRLNVWFSRAKECIHFVLSKPIKEFTWEIKNAMLFYESELENWKNKIIWWTDPKSWMEPKIQHYFYETSFYKDNKADIEFIPQFPVGEYLKQLDRTYQHPGYKVDFLLIYKEKKYIVEYDWFEVHFESDWEKVDTSNYQHYMKEDDVYRQKVLEWYWYEFLRLNKFNLWKDPIESFNTMLENLVKKKSKFLSR